MPSHPPSTPRRDLLLAIRAFAGGQVEVLGELGLDGRGDIIYLARAAGDGALVGLRVEAPGKALRDGRTVALAIESDLDSLVTASPRCPRCAAPVAADGLCRSCQLNPLSGQLLREPPSSAVEVRQLLRGYGLESWVPAGDARQASDGTPFYYVHDAAAERALLLFLRVERPDDHTVLYGPCLAPAFAGSAPLDELPATLTGVMTAGGAGAAASAPASAPASPTPGKSCPQCGSLYAGDMMFCPRDGTALRVPGGSTSLVGSVIAERYHVLSILGEGGMGKVYLAEHVKIRRRCAIKVMSAALAQDADAAGRFVREAENAARVSHPNVAAVYDFGEMPDGTAYLAMELVEGEPLSRILEREHTLPPGRAADLARQVALGLAAAHELGIVHRDLKPDNVMVTRGRDGRDVVKVVDFGIAKAESRGTQQITRTGIVIGTPEYMSPEQLLGDQVDARSDLYALGCILHRTLTGRAPFARAGGDQLLAIGARLTAAPPRPSETTPGVPPVFDEVVARLMAPEPARRYQAAAEVAEVLRPLTGITSAAAAVAPASEASAAPSVISGASSVSSSVSGTAARPPITAERPATLRPAIWRWAAVAGVVVGVATGAWALLKEDGRPAAATLASARAADSGATRAGAATSDTPTGTPAPDSETGAPAETFSARTDSPVPREAARERGPATRPEADRREVAPPAAGREREKAIPAPVESAPRAVAQTPVPAVPAGGASGSAAAPPPVRPMSGGLPAGAPPTDARRTQARHEARTAINALVSRFELVIEERSVGALRELYPAMSREQQQYWRELLSDTRNVRNLDAQLAVVRWSGDDEPYEVEFAGTLTFRDGRNAEQRVAYRAQGTATPTPGGGFVFTKLEERFGS